MPKITVFTRPGCEACDQLKAALRSRGRDFQELDGQSAEGLTALRCGGCFPAYYPVLQVGPKFYEYAALFGERGELRDLREMLA